MRATAAPAPPGGRLRLTSEGLAWFAAAGMLALLGWAKGLNLLLMLAYVMVGLLVVNGVLARMHARRVRARRTLPPPLFAGESAELQIALSNIASHAASVRTKDREKAWHVANLAPGASVSFQTFETFPTRGRIALPPLSAGSGFPFGFLEYERPESTEDAVAVLPALGTADAEGLRRWLLRASGGEGRARKVLRRVTHEHADVRGIRPYRSGDSLHTVHWRSSARRGELMVREYDAAPSPELLLVVEPWLPANPTPQDRERLEAALSLAATIARAWCHTLDSRAVVALGADVNLASESTFRHALLPLADAEGSHSPALPDVSNIARSALRSARLVVSSRSGTSLADELTREVGRPFASLDASRPIPWYQPPRRGGAA